MNSKFNFTVHLTWAILGLIYVIMFFTSGVFTDYAVISESTFDEYVYLGNALPKAFLCLAISGIVCLAYIPITCNDYNDKESSTFVYTAIGVILTIISFIVRASFLRDVTFLYFACIFVPFFFVWISKLDFVDDSEYKIIWFFIAALLFSIIIGVIYGFIAAIEYKPDIAMFIPWIIIIGGGLIGAPAAATYYVIVIKK